MSFEPNDQESTEELKDSQNDIIKWLKVIAHILGDMQNIDPNEIYEDID